MEASTPTPPPPTEPPPPEPPAPSTEYPARLNAVRQDEYNRFLPLVKWLLAFPHYVVLVVLAIGMVFAGLAGLIMVLFTARYPRGLWDYVTGVHRWAARVGAYILLLTDRYPPFALADDPEYPVRVEYDYPEHMERWRIFQFILVIPAAFIAGLLGYVSAAVAFIGIFVILFTGKLPEGMFKLILNPMRWQLRSNAYGHTLVNRYPPFEWDE